jgi:hypothetical protein
MNLDFLDNHGLNYITHVILHGERIIPSDSFEIGENEYLLLEILKSTDNIIFLKIIGIKGSDFGSIYLIPKEDFEDKTLKEIKERLKDYKHL